MQVRRLLGAVLDASRLCYPSDAAEVRLCRIDIKLCVFGAPRCEDLEIQPTRGLVSFYVGTIFSKSG